MSTEVGASQSTASQTGAPCPIQSARMVEVAAHEAGVTNRGAVQARVVIESTEIGDVVAKVFVDEVGRAQIVAIDPTVM